MSNHPTNEALEQRIADLERQLEAAKNAKQQLTKSQAALNSIIAAAPIGIGLVSDRVLLWVNDKMCEMIGYSKEELLGQSARILYPTEEEYLRAGQEKYAQIDRTGSGSVETCFMCKNKTKIQVLLSSVPINPHDRSEGVTFTVLDVTNQKLAEERLINERDRAQMYLDTADVVLLALDINGNVKLINKKGCEITGYDEQEMIRRNWFDSVIPENQIEETKYIFNNLLNGQTQNLENYENTIMTKNGDLRDMAWHNTLLKNKKGGISGIFCSGLDVTDRNRMENEKQELQLQLIKTQKMEAIGVLAGGIAHDFNNILLPILGYTELLLESCSDDTSTRDILHQILQAAKRARSLVKQILTFSRQENHEIKPVDMSLILYEVTKLIRSSLPSTIEVRQNISKNCGLVLADPSQIHQIAMNLITNSYHAMEQTGGQLTIELSGVQLQGSTSDDLTLNPGRYVCLSVTDTGVGMEKQVLDRIFDPYFTTKKKGKGTGLGLSVVHGIVKSYGGHIKAESTPGKGSIFYVFLPAISMTDEIKEEMIAASQFKRGCERILLVDDESQVIHMETQRLERLGYQVTSRTSPSEAFELFKNNPERFDLVITDMTMPKLTGGQLAKKLLEIKPDLPIIICTGFSEQVNAIKAKEMGIKGFVQKPILLGEISNLIREVLDEK